jgi:MFS transporter, Spinster family, sphingosine-1-phosphate transporter
MGALERPGTTLGVLSGINVLNYLDRYLAAALLPLIITDLSLSDGRGGALQSIFIVVYAAVSPAIGWMGDRGTRLRLAAFGVVLWSAATFGSGLAPTFAWLLVARALVGVGEASYAVVTPSVIADLYPPGRRGRALGLFYSAIPLGTAMGYMLGGWIGSHYGWRWAFFLAGGPGLLLAFALLLIREPPRGRFDVNRPESVPLSLAASWRALRQRPSYLYNTAAQTIYTFAMGGLATWMPTYFVRERHLSLENATFIFGLVLVSAGFLGTLVGGQVSDRLSRRFPAAPFVFSGFALVASIPFTLAATLSPSPAIFWPAMFVTLLLLFLNTGPLNAAMANVLPADLRARGFALYTVAIHFLGDALSPTLIGVTSDAIGLRIPILMSGLMLAIAGLVLLVGRRALVADMPRAAS